MIVLQNEGRFCRFSTGSVAFEFVKRFPFELVDDYGEDTIEEGDTDMLNDDERAALADEQDIKANEQNIPL